MHLTQVIRLVYACFPRTMANLAGTGWFHPVVFVEGVFVDLGLVGLIDKMEDALGPGAIKVMFVMIYVGIAAWLSENILRFLREMVIMGESPILWHQIVGHFVPWAVMGVIALIAMKMVSIRLLARIDKKYSNYQDELTRQLDESTQRLEESTRQLHFANDQITECKAVLAKAEALKSGV